MRLKRYSQFLESKSDMWDIIPQSVKDLHKIFQSAGKKLYLVGGSVRDFLTGDKPKDFDLATDALPDEVLEIIGDKVPAVLQVRHTGDDYNTWSSYRAVDLNQSRPQLYLCGQDRRRAWEFLCTDAVPLRIDAAEVDFDIGEIDQDPSSQPARYRR